MIERIRQGIHELSYAYAHPYTALRRREWPDEAYRWQYLRAIFGMLEERLGRQPKDKQTVEVRDDEETASLPTLVYLLEAIAQVTQGAEGWTALGTAVDLEALRSTTAKWRAWMRENDPERKKPSSKPA